MTLSRLILPLALATALNAQDTRTVTEPVVPPICATLRATLSAPIAPTDEASLDTLRLQKAIDRCPAGHALELAADADHTAFLSGALELRTGVTLLIDKGVTLFGSRDPRDYQKAPGTCGLVNDLKAGCYPLIEAKNTPNAAIMGEGTIDGRGGAKLLVAGQPQSKSWWDLANDARAAGRQQVPRLIEMEHADNFTLYNITLKNSANFHVTYHHGNGFTVWGLRIDTPKNARNTDGIDPSASSNITVTNSFIRTGDDNIAIKGGEGPVTNMTVAHNHFYYGHGMSIGSETNAGVSALRVTDLSLDGTDAGLRIKSNPSRGGLVIDIVYDDVCIRNSRVPISLTTDYTYPGARQDLLPTYTGIYLHNVRISGGGKLLLESADATHRIGIHLDGVLVTDAPALYKPSIRHADVSLGPAPVNLPLFGSDSNLNGKPSQGSPLSCSAKFVPFPTDREPVILPAAIPSTPSIHPTAVTALRVSSTTATR